jgi:hypothetical protein
MSQQIQTGVLVGGASDGKKLKLAHPDMERLIVDRPRKLTSVVSTDGTRTTKQKYPFDTYLLTNLRCFDDGNEFLFYRHDSLTHSQAFALLFQHYGEKAR